MSIGFTERSYAPKPRGSVPEFAERIVPLPLFSKRCHHCGAWLSVWEEWTVAGPNGRVAHAEVCRACGRYLARRIEKRQHRALRGYVKRAVRRRLRMSLPAHAR